MMEELTKQKQEVCDVEEEKLKCLVLSLLENRPKHHQFLRNYYKNSTDMLHHLIHFSVKQDHKPLKRKLLELKPYLKSFRLSYAQKFSLLSSTVAHPDPANEQFALLLLENGVHLKMTNASVDRLLALAIKNDMSALVQGFLKRGKVIDKTSASAIASICESQKWIELVVDATSNDRLRRNLCIEKLLLSFVRNDRMTELESLLKFDLPISTAVKVVDSAIEYWRIKAVEMLLQRDPGIKNEPRLLVKASGHKETSICRMLIEYGADINARIGTSGQYPIHAACRRRSLKNAHLLMNLGANVNAVTDCHGDTPFSLLIVTNIDEHFEVDEEEGEEEDEEEGEGEDEEEGEEENEEEDIYTYLKSAEPLVDMFIKHFAILTFKQIKINDRDLSLLDKHSKTKKYRDCLSELEKMKHTYVFNNVPFSCLFDGDAKRLLALVRNNDFTTRFHSKIQEKQPLFPNYSMQMMHLFQVALRKQGVLDFYERELAQVFSELLSSELPYIVMEKIVWYVCWDELKNVERDYYLFLHEQIEKKVRGYELSMLF